MNVSGTGTATACSLISARKLADSTVRKFFGSNGRYLREVMNDNRLITSRSKKSWVRGSFGPRRSGSYARCANYAGYAMYAGYEDFPAPDSFR